MANQYRDFEPFPGGGGAGSRPPTDWRKEWAGELNQPVQYKPATGQVQEEAGTQVTTAEFTGERPEYEKPVWDEGEIRKLSRKIQAPSVRRLRQQVQQVVSKHYENPNVRSLMLRNALQGYGIGLEHVLSGAETQARGEYAQRYSFDVNAAMAKFQAAMNEYMASAKRTTTRAGTTGVQQTFDAGGSGTFGQPTWRDWQGPAALNPYISQPRRRWQLSVQ